MTGLEQSGKPAGAKSELQLLNAALNQYYELNNLSQQYLNEDGCCSGDFAIDHSML